MSSLFGSLSIAMRALMAQQGALQVTSQNIANVNTPGYSRQVPILNEGPPVFYGGQNQFGTGVSLDKVISIRDKILNLRIYQETQQQGKFNAYLGPAQQVESLFNIANGGGIQGALSDFFGSLSRLSTNPADMTSRQAVLDAGRTLAATIKRTDTQLKQVQSSLDQGVGETLETINQLTSQIAELNSKVSAAQATGQNSGIFEDQRDQLIGQLSGLIDVSVIDAGQGKLTLTTVTGTPLVVGDTNWALAAQPDPSTGHLLVMGQGMDITAKISAGKLGGLLRARDQFIPSVQAGLDDLAANLTQSFNTQHTAGFDLNGTAGGDFFTPFVPGSPGSTTGAAALFGVAITDPAAVAGSGDGTPGDNTNLAALIGLSNQPVVGNQTPSDFYASLIARVGNEVSGASAEMDAGNLELLQLQNQRSAVSQVSLDEEATNLIRYQRAFEAAARVVNVVDSLTQTALSLGKE